MYNEQLENLINAALADGVLTEKEKQILFKRAQSMGIDLDEFEMVLDARLVELAKAEKAKAEASAPKSNKMGDIKKCPSCGAIVNSYQGVCHECGYTFENVVANSSAQKLAETIERIKKETREKEVQLKNKKIEANSGIKNMFSDNYVHVDDTELINQAIMNFPIPNTKADLIEFITSLKAKCAMSDLHEIAYATKYRECIEKARIIFAKDPTLSAMVVDYDMNHKGLKNWWIKNKGVIIALIAVVIGFTLIIGGALLVS